jgi:hypothetical protein
MDQPAGVAIRYVDALTANAGAELYFGDSKLLAGETNPETGYIEVPNGRRVFELRHRGKEPLVRHREELRGGAHYTVIAFDDQNGKPAVIVVNDEEAAPSNGKAKVRLIDAAARAGDFDLYVADRRLGNLTAESAPGPVSAWEEVDAGRQPVELRTRDRSPQRISVPDSGLLAGNLYTFVLTDRRTDRQPVQVVTLENQPTKVPRTGAPTVPPGA